MSDMNGRSAGSGRDVITFVRHIFKEQEGSYFTVPFEVPEGVTRLDVEYHYPGHVKGAAGDRRPVNTIDLGLEDETGKMLGWSGSAKDHVYVGPEDSEKGYLMEAVNAGTWKLILGAYHVAEGGVDVTVTVRFGRRRLRLLFGDLHVHSTCSDGAYDWYDLARMARSMGLDFIAFADHNNWSENLCQPRIPGMTVIPAVEWTHYLGHMNLFGAVNPFENSFVVNTPEEKKRLLEAARKKGAVVSVNHPDCPICPYKWDDTDYDMMEIWNGPMTPRNWKAIARWTALLTEGRRIPAVGGSDFHRSGTPVLLGHPVTGVFASGTSPEDILRAIRKGRAFVTESVRGPRLMLRSRKVFMGGVSSVDRLTVYADNLGGCDLTLVSDQGEQRLLGPGHLSFCQTIRPGRVKFAYVKAVLPGMPQIVRAVSNPIYFR
ncbi:MAG: CehA/McbA family metallohydrolase [Lachnospiraceae bacterium]|jgi:predicted metal-dependent phosphoesterase TrpH